MIFSPSFHLLHLSPRAAQLITPFVSHPEQGSSKRSVPPLLIDVGRKVRDELQTSLKQGDGLTSHVEHALSSVEGMLYVRGLGMPDRDGGDFLMVLILSTSPSNACRNPIDQPS
jgi:hypothetical protein